MKSSSNHLVWIAKPQAADRPDRPFASSRHGFTLFELVLVMVLACLAVAMVAPSLSGWSRGAQLRDAADQFVSLTRLARSRAVAEGITYRLNIDAQAGQYQLMVQNGENFVPLQSSWGTARALPESVQMKFQSASNGAAAQSYIDFSPTGLAEPATISFTSSRGQTLTVDCPSPAEGFIVEQPSGGAR